MEEDNKEIIDDSKEIEPEDTDIDVLLQYRKLLQNTLMSE